MNEGNQVLCSNQDASVNFVTGADVGKFESRFVRREERYFSCYLSVQSGCNLGCRFCHLTTTKQTKSLDATVDDLVAQAAPVIEHANEAAKGAECVHFNFMARGEPLSSAVFVDYWDEIAEALGKFSCERRVRFLVSTIMPKDGPRSLFEVFDEKYLPDIYYSIYSMDPVFRKRWLPNALPAEQALDMLAEWQSHTKKIPKLHWALIEGENDTREDIIRITRAVKNRGLRVDVNIVRYNPPDEKTSEPREEDVWFYAFCLKKDLPGAKVKVIPRVGFDVKASCGMFVS